MLILEYIKKNYLNFYKLGDNSKANKQKQFTETMYETCILIYCDYFKKHYVLKSYVNYYLQCKLIWIFHSSFKDVSHVILHKETRKGCIKIISSSISIN